MNEPISDAVRGILDGHIVLSRALATANHFPAIEVLESVSRLINDICEPEQVANAGKARDLMAIYRKNEDLINIGAYTKKSNAKIDLAIDKQEGFKSFLRQGVAEKFSREESFLQLDELLK